MKGQMTTSLDRWVAGIAVGIISLVVGAGCGGNDSTTTLTKAEFTKEANLVCKKSRWQIRAAMARMNRRYYQIEGADTAGEPDNGNLEVELGQRMLDKFILPAMKERLEDLEELDAPAGDEARISKMLKTHAVAIDELEDKGLVLLFQFKTLHSFQREAAALGLDCTASYRVSPAI
jgi:hypothetical protein